MYRCTVVYMSIIGIAAKGVVRNTRTDNPLLLTSMISKKVSK